VTIGDSLTQGMKVFDHALHLTTVVTDAEVALLEDAEPSIELQNTQLMDVDELSLECEPRLMSGLRRFLNDHVEFRGEGVEDPCHHNVVQPNPISGQIGDIREDVVVQGVSMKHEKHKVAPSYVLNVVIPDFVNKIEYSLHVC
jgi:hypothetical protein